MSALFQPFDIGSLSLRNRIVVAVRAPQGAGGLLAAIDIAPETENWIVTDGQWKIYRRWDPLILQFDIAGQWERPVIVGEPPIGRWNYQQIVKRDAAPDTPAFATIERPGSTSRRGDGTRCSAHSRMLCGFSRPARSPRAT